VFGAVVGVAGAVVAAVVEAFLTPLRWDTIRLPVSVLLAVLTNLLLLWFTYRATGHKLVALLPGLVWMVLMVLVSDRTAEGDIVLAANNWVVYTTILAGVTAYVIGAYRLLTQR
jgi:hypothetical protein